MSAKVVVIVKRGMVEECFSDTDGIEIELLDFDTFAVESEEALRAAERRRKEVAGSMRSVSF